MKKKSHLSPATTHSEGGPMDSILAQWRRERPDIDPSPMAVCGEIWRAGERLRQEVLANLVQYNLDFAGFDVLLTLRRQGKGETLSPSALAKDMMLSTSAMTNRLDRLEKRGLVLRASDPQDRRGLKIALTEEGFAMADEIVASHVRTEENMISELTETERDQLRNLLGKIR
ncbi:MarR family transcriptional regulator [Kiloniella laminariae]|uniref:MarR family transcriptional regulator n=1 Tax=Kiloniella laminariae TaxID=454162 RepID=A0ABT4LHZ1_9PROT|nr:MarR family transcriptional regulator [Kiloniella laminariae]MCZ4280719.1 MarR family transcriptional regulator [Kiloniella laminariae]